MSSYQESGIHVDLTGKPHFRFENLTAYKKISNKNMKELDFCWLEQGQLIMLELTNYSTEKNTAREDGLGSEQFKSKFIAETAQKVLDSLLMLAACWIPTPKGNEFRKELPQEFHNFITSIAILVVVELPAGFSIDLQPIQWKLNKILGGKLDLFDIIYKEPDDRNVTLRVRTPDRLDKLPYASCITPLTPPHPERSPAWPAGSAGSGS